MGIITTDDIAGVWNEAEIICRSCGAGIIDEVQFRKLILKRTVANENDHLYYCDRCGNRLEDD